MNLSKIFSNNYHYMNIVCSGYLRKCSYSNALTSEKLDRSCVKSALPAVTWYAPTNRSASALYRPTFSDKRRKSFHQQPPFCAGETEKNFGICRVNFLFFLTSFYHKLYHSVYFKVLSEIVLFDR